MSNKMPTKERWYKKKEKCHSFISFEFLLFVTLGFVALVQSVQFPSAFSFPTTLLPGKNEKKILSSFKGKNIYFPQFHENPNARIKVKLQYDTSRKESYLDHGIYSATDIPTFFNEDIVEKLHNLKDIMKKEIEKEVSQSGNREDSMHNFVFVFPGQGNQWKGVGDSLMTFSEYRKTISICDSLFKKYAGWSLMEKVSNLTERELTETIYALPITVFVQIGIYHLLKKFNIQPDICIGHSAGEIAAAYASSRLTIEEAIRISYVRSTLQQKLSGSGRLLALSGSEADIKKFLNKNYLQDISKNFRQNDDSMNVEIACINSPKSIVLVSTEPILLDIKAGIDNSKIPFAVLVPGNIAFHSSMTESIVPQIISELNFLDDEKRRAIKQNINVTNESKRPSLFLEAFDKRLKTEKPIYISSVTGKDEYILDGKYWASNLRNTVQFDTAIRYGFLSTKELGLEKREEMSETQNLNTYKKIETVAHKKIVIEVGPHKVLSGPILQILKGLDVGKYSVLSTLKRNTN